MAPRALMASLAVVLVAVLMGVPTVFAAYGVDISQADCPSVTSSQWKCLVDSYNETFVIIEAFDGGYQINKQIASCVNNAWAAGFKHVDVYAFFCPNCNGNNPASTAMNNLVAYLRNNNVKFGTLWLDVEQCTGCWSTNLASNFQYVQDLVSAAQKLSVTVGIYSSTYEWQQTVGNAQGLQSLPLWYAHYDGNPSFSDYPSYAFGGWTSPAMKQFNDHGAPSCSVNVDIDWYPD